MAEEAEEKNGTRQPKKKAEPKAKKPRTKKKGSKKDGDEEEDDTKGGGFLIALVVILIVAIWLAIFALIVKMDVGGFGSTVLYPVLKDVPVLNKILPDVETYSDEDDQYNFATMDDAVKRIKELEQQLKDAQSSSDTTSAQIADLEAQAQELQTYKQNEANFEAEKEKFYEEVVFSDKAPDIDEYKEYYESIEPDNAAAIYKEVVEQQQASKEIQDYASAYSSMKPKEAAAIFDTMTNDLSLVAKILGAMSADDRGDILGQMNQDTAAQVTELMNPSGS